MSVPTRNPMRMIGATPQNSGFPQTGELPFTQGGMLKATVFSGGLLSPGSGFLPTGAVKIADQLLLVSGAGRLNKVLTIPALALSLSGAAITFYDSCVPCLSGGSPVTSGYAVIGVVNAPGGVSGQFGLSNIQEFGMPFSSGLCVSCVSGTVGFTVTYTSEVNPTLP